MRRMRIVLPILILGLLFIVGIVLTHPSQAQGAPVWLPFDGRSQPVGPGLSLLSANAAEIRLQASLPGAYAEPVTAGGAPYTRLSGTGYGFPAKYGLPELPVLRREVEIPFGAQVSVEIISAQSMEASLGNLGLSPIYPMQPPVPKVQAAEDNQPFTMDEKFYASGSSYPSSLVSVGEPYVVRGHRILQVEIWPVSYDPSHASVHMTSQVTFRLVLRGADMTTTNRLADRYASPAFDPLNSQQVLNYNQGRPLETNDLVGYLIITADPYAAAIAPLVALRENRGFQVTLTLQSAIPGGNTTAGIKAYIQEAYDTWTLPPSYVLLVGDTNTIPTYTGPIIQTSTDLYYATMDGSSDWHPDIGRGRFPVRSAEQTTWMVDKYLAYATLTGQEAWLKTASFPATCDRYTVAEGTHNYVIDSYTGPGGWSGTFPNNPQPGGDKLYCVTYSAEHQDLINQFNLGRWAIIYSGHGSYDGWEMSFTPTDVDNLTGYGMFPFVASHACLSGDFGQPEVFGETWVLQQNKGALVYWGSSTYSYWDEDDVLERVTFDTLFTPVVPHADVTVMTYAGLAGVEEALPSSAQYYWETYNILGDPAVHLFMEPDQPAFTLNIDPSSQQVCTAGSLSSTVEIGSILNYSSTVYLETGELPFNVSASFDPAEAAAPYSSTLTLDVTPGALEGDYTIPITATDRSEQTLATDLNLRINTALPTPPTQVNPADGATGQLLTPAFDWLDIPVVGAYNFELGTSPLFESPLISASGLLTSTYTPPALAGNTCYWWHTQADNACGTGDWAEPFHFSTVNLGVPFYDDMESGAGLWSHAAAQGIDHWVISADNAHSPTHAWFVPDDIVTTDTRLWTTEPIQVGAGSTLTFWHTYQYEGDNYDGSVLEISTDLGDTWNDLGPAILSNGYNGTINEGYSNPLGGRDGWVGDQASWTEVTVDLGAFAGQQVMLRWRLGCDSSAGDTGWYIDDVQITAPLPPNPSPALTGIEPGSGYSGEDTPVVISGSGFFGAPAVKLGETWLESVEVVNATTIHAVVPMGIADGLYDLLVFNGDCQSALLPEAFIVTSIAEPISGLAASNDSPTFVGHPTQFAATVETGTGVVYDWDFGDGSFGHGRTPSHIYTSLGNFTAIVTATNPINSDVTTTGVTIVEEPIAGLTAANDGPTELGDTTILTATIDAGTSVSYAWDFGDGASGLGAVVTHTYALVGEYTALVTATNSLGSVITGTLVSIVDVPIAGLTAVNDGPTMLGAMTTFTATLSAGTNVTYTWDFGDGGTGNGKLVTHAYAVDGIFTASVTAANSINNLTVTTQVTVLIPPHIIHYIYLPVTYK